MSNPFLTTGLSLTGIAENAKPQNPSDGQIIFINDDGAGNPLSRYEYYHASSGQWFELGSGPADPAIFLGQFDINGNPIQHTGIGGLDEITPANLVGKSVAEVLDYMLYPTLYATYNASNASVSKSGTLTGGSVEYGTTKGGTLQYTFNDVTWSSTYLMTDPSGNPLGNSGTLTGALNKFELLTDGASSNVVNTPASPQTVTISDFDVDQQITFAGKYSYDASTVVLYNSKGGVQDPGTRDDAGTATSPTLTITPYFPVFVNDTTGEVKANITSNGSDFTFNTSGWPTADGQQILFALDYGSLANVFTFNSISGNIDANGTASWSRVANVTKTFGSSGQLSVTYAVYEYTGSPTNFAGNIRFDFNSAATNP
jgi:hypothetical protein